MKKYLKELIVILFQLLVFYVSPLFAKEDEMIGLVLLIAILTFFLALAFGIISNKKIKYFYPIIAAVLFVPTVFIYYNSSAFIHALWYFLESVIGIALGTLIYKLMNNKKK